MSKVSHEGTLDRRRGRRWSRDVIVAALLSVAACVFIMLALTGPRPEPDTVGSIDIERHP